MAVAFVSSGEQSTLSGSPRTFSINPGAGSDKYMIVSVQYSVSGSVTGVDFNGTPLSQIGTEIYAGYYIALYGLANPANGTATVTVTLSSGIARTQGAVYSGVAGGIGTAGQGTVGAGSPVNFPYTVTVASSWITGVISVDAGTTMSMGTGTVNRGTISTSVLADSNSGLSTGVNNLQATYGGGFGSAGYVLTELKESGGAVGPANVKTFDGVTQSTGISTYLGVALADTKTVNGVA